ncbi:MAG: monovalent cation/H(+) antiporter subunit G [Alphaproteobacteria bacterium]
MSAVLDIASWLLLMAGCFFIVTGGVGLLRLPDFFTRLHSAGIVDTLGAALVVAGLMLQAGLGQVSVKLLLILVFLFFTSPTATHAVAHAALVGGLKPWTKREGKDGA